MKIRQALPTIAVALMAVVVLPACAPLILGGAAVGGALVASDRRTSGTQVEDQSIELKAASMARERAPNGNVSVTSYNRVLLLTGEVPTEGERAALEESIGRIVNVRSVVNELAVAPSSSMTTRSNDSIISAKVKATFFDAAGVEVNAVKVITDRGIVYLMGIVTEREAGRATELTRSVDGVKKVVRVFEVISEEALANIVPKPAPAK